MFRRLRARRRDARMQAALQSLAPEQRARFEAASAEFSDHFRAASAHDMTSFVVPTWSDFNASIEAALLPRPSFSFLRNETMLHTMFVNAGGAWLDGQLRELRAVLSEDELTTWIREDPAGTPKIKVPSLLTSHNRVHHASHLIRHARHAVSDVFDAESIVEWGGGYGGVARLVLRRSRKQPTYIMIRHASVCLSTVVVSPNRDRDDRRSSAQDRRRRHGRGCSEHCAPGAS